jgi:hypothetical protein
MRNLVDKNNIEIKASTDAKIYKDLKLTNDKRLKEIIEMGERMNLLERPIIEDLARNGLVVDTIWGRHSLVDRAVADILAKHLILPYHDRIIEGVARALSTPKARHLWPLLVQQYRNAPEGIGVDGLHLGAKEGLAQALSGTATPLVFDELIDLIKDNKNGPTRCILVSRLTRSRDPKIISAIMEFKNDPQLSKEISSWKKHPANI